MEDERANETHWQTFSQDSSMHGIRYVTIKNGSKCRRIVWTVAFMVCLVYCLAGISLFLNDFAKRTVITKLKVKNAQQLKFPTVTICNRNLWERSATEAMHSIIPGMQDLIVNMLTDIYRDGELPPPEGRYNWSHPVLEIMIGEAAHGRMVDILEQLAPTLNGTFQHCYLKGKRVPCHQIISRVYTDGGICFRFNDQGTFEAHGTGANGGVYFVLNARIDEYYIGPISHAEGFVIALHDEDEVPLMEEVSYGISPGFETTIMVKKHQIRREPPYADNGQSDCFDASKLKNPLHFHPAYSQSACVHECKISFIINRCGCADTFDPPLNETRTCNVKEVLECSAPATREFYTEPNYLHSCKCKPRCHEVWYSPELSLNRFPGKAFSRDLNYTAEQELYARENLVALKISYGQMTYQDMEESVVYSGWDLIANIGGTLGVCIGASLLTLIEFVEFAVKSINQRLWKQKNRTTPGIMKE